MEVKKILQEIECEHTFAISKFPPFNSAHEGYAVILEEMEELKCEVFTKQPVRDNAKLRKEAIQVATMAIRFVIDICDRRE